MSYYKPSYSQTAAMTRGRGYPRGSYRGSSRGGGSWGGGGGGSRGYRGSRGGGGRFDPTFSSTFDSRSKYGGSSDRYQSSRGHDDSFSRKSYRVDSYASSRDSHRSPDRKRPRTEAPSSRHESPYGGGGSGGGRYESGYSQQDRRSFSSDRHHHSASGSSPYSPSRRDATEFRRPSGFPPRGGYRGRMSSRRPRGIRGGRGGIDRSSRGYGGNSSYFVRKRIISSRSADYQRRLKISKMRSAIAAARKKVDSDKEEESDDDDVEKKLADEDEDEEMKDADDVKKEDEDEKETSATKKSASDKETGGSEKGEKPDKSETEAPVGGHKKTFVKLNCPHCGIKCLTFYQYDLHLQGRTHMMAMRKVAIKQKSIMSQMRLAQRKAQNDLEKSSDDLIHRTNYCPLCKLNYKQRKLVHQTSEAHKNMKSFLMPYCKVCSITFKSPMMYESHCCSIEHLKRKQRLENGEHSDDFDEDHNLENFTTIDSVGVEGDASEEEESAATANAKEPVNVGIEHIRKVSAYYCDFCRMYVGIVTDEHMPAILARHCKMRTHMQKYIRYKEDQELEKRAEKLQRKEMAQKSSASAADKDNGQVKENDKAKNNNDETASIADETVESESPGKKTVDGKDKEEKESADAPNKDDDEARDDKLWADVDKDLDDILAKESGNKSSDEEEDANGERFDRFRYSEKNGDDKKETDSSKPAAIVAEAKEAKQEK